MLKKLIEKLCCKHKWERREKVEDTLTNRETGKKRTVRITIIYICIECGKFKKIRL